MVQTHISWSKIRVFFPPKVCCYLGGLKFYSVNSSGVEYMPKLFQGKPSEQSIAQLSYFKAALHFIIMILTFKVQALSVR